MSSRRARAVERNRFNKQTNKQTTRCIVSQWEQAGNDVEVSRFDSSSFWISIPFCGNSRSDHVIKNHWADKAVVNQKKLRAE